MNAILLVFNSSIPSSYTDAITYLARRNLPMNLLGVNFGTVPTVVTQAQALASVYTVQSLIWNGVADTSFNGNTLYWGLYWTAQKYAVDGVILSTYTPLVYANTQSPINRPLPATFGAIVYLARFNNGTSVIPNGRLGSPSHSANNFSFATEMTTRSGSTLANQAVLNAIAAESRYNKGEPHLLSTATSYGSQNSSLGMVSTTFGYTVAYYQSLMSYARSQGLNWTLDLGLDYAFNTGSATDFALGTLPAPLSLWAMCLPVGINDRATLAPGDHPYSGNYVVRPGGWSCHWYSYQWAWSMDFLFNGGSAAVVTVSEPLSDGIREPRRILEGVLSGLALMETLTLAVNPRSCPAYVVNPAYPDCVTVLGDPLYRPYAVSARLSGAASVPLMRP